MRIVLDNIVFDLQRFGGISVVWYELIHRLQQQADLELGFLDNDCSDNDLRRDLKIAPDIVLGRNRFPKLLRYLPVVYNQTEPFIFHSSYYRYCTSKNAINITTVHDFTYELYRKGMQRRVHSWHKFGAIRHSDYVVCISENTRRDLLNFLPDVDEDRVRVIYNGVSDDYCLIPSSSVDDARLPFESGKYVVYVGDRSEYKNFPLCVCAVKETDYNLVIVGKKLNEEELAFVSRQLPEQRYYVTGFVKSQELNIIYNHAAALVYPSSYEGFGIPVVEAQKAGCPVIAYNASSIPEVIGNTPLLMHELSARELVEKLALLTKDEVAKQVKADGLENSRRFSWDKMAEAYVGLYQEAMKRI